MLRTRTRRYEALGLLLLAGGLALGVVIWKANTRTTSGTIGGGDVFTEARDADACSAQAQSFTDYPLVWAGPSVLGYPLASCAHMMTKTRYLPDGSVLHPGGDAWVFVYGTCVTPKGEESCPVPIAIRIDPCALTVDGRTIPKASQPVRSMTLRGAKADLSRDGVLHFEQSPQIITIYAPPQAYLGQGLEAYAAEKAANAVAIAEALIPANALASPLSSGAPLTAAFAAAPDTLCRNSFVPGAAATASIAKPAAPTDTPEPPAPDAPATSIDIHLAGGPTIAVPGGSSGNTFTIEVTGVTSLKGYSIAAEYDESVISVTAVADISGLPSPVCPGNSTTDGGGLHGSDAARFAFERTCGSTATTGLPRGTVALVRVTFTCLGSGTSTAISFDSAPNYTIATVDSADTDSATHVNGIVHCG